MASNIKDSQRFIPLNDSSQGIIRENVLFFDNSASIDNIYMVATARFRAAFNLLDCIGRLQKQYFPVDISPEVCSVTRILLSDANSLLKLPKVKGK